MEGAVPSTRGPSWLKDLLRRIFRDKAERPADKRGEFSVEENVVMSDSPQIQGPGLERGGWGWGLLDATQTGALSRSLGWCVFKSPDILSSLCFNLMDTPFQFAERYCMCVTPEASTASSLALSAAQG